MVMFLWFERILSLICNALQFMWRRNFHGTYSGTYSKKWIGLIPKNFQDSYSFLTGFNSFSDLCQFPLSITYLLRPLYMVVEAIWTNIDEVLSINPRANIFVSKDFHCHHKDWLNYSGGTCRFGELTEIVNFPAQIPQCDS